MTRVQVRAPVLPTGGGLLSPLAAWRSLWGHRDLIRGFAGRELLATTRGSALGVLWELLNPIATVLVFTFLFSVVLQVKWDAAGVSGDTSGFVVMMLAGLVVFTIFGDAIGRAPTLVTGQPNLVTKIVFPVEVLPVSTTAVAMVPAGILAVAVVVVRALTGGGVSGTVWLAPVVLLPTVLLTLGCAWLLAGLGVFLRDIGPLVQLFVGRVLFFLTPIFYPREAVPDGLRFVLDLNPLTHMVEQTRAVLVLGEMPNWAAYFGLLVLSAACAQGGYAFFVKGKRSYADVL